MVFFAFSPTRPFQISSVSSPSPFIVVGATSHAFTSHKITNTQKPWSILLLTCLRCTYPSPPFPVRKAQEKQEIERKSHGHHCNPSAQAAWSCPYPACIAYRSSPPSLNRPIHSLPPSLMDPPQCPHGPNPRPDPLLLTITFPILLSAVITTSTPSNNVLP